jgi:hypothetical protein
MAWLKNLLGGLSGSKELCSGCQTHARVAGTVKVTNEERKLCSKCWKQLLANEARLDKTIENHKRHGRLEEDADNYLLGGSERCLNCAKEVDAKLLIVFNRPVRPGEQVVNLYGHNKTAPVAVILGLCLPCGSNFVPGLKD